MTGPINSRYKAIRATCWPHRGLVWVSANLMMSKQVGGVREGSEVGCDVKSAAVSGGKPEFAVREEL